jgi:uncharacterized heparinase superfamily protein
VTPGGLGRTLRTLRPLRARQLWGQLRQRLRGVRPRRWSGPAPTLRLRAPVAPFLEAPAHARFDGWRRFRLLNREVSFQDQIDWDFAGEGPLWAYHLHQFDYLRRPGLPAAARRALILDWIERHPAGTGWEPHPLALRILCWTRLLATPGALPLDAGAEAQVRASLAAQAETLAAHLETHLLANHYLSDLLALVFAGVAHEGAAADAWLAHEVALRRELREQVGADGLHFERSPMYHALLLENVLDLRNAALACPGRAPAALETALAETGARMLGALETLTLPDGGLALFADSAHGIAAPPATLLRYGRALGLEPRHPDPPGVLRDGGYVRLERAPFTLVASVAGPAPAYQPGHAHCDALAFELCVGGERVVADAGVAEYIPGALRDWSRATRAHATLEVGGRDQAEVWAAHRVGGRPRVELVRVEPGASCEALCAGWSTPDSVHRRRFRLSGASLEIEDRIEGRPRPVVLTLPFAPGLEPVLSGSVARVRLAQGGRLRVSLPPAARWSLERQPCFPEFGRVVERAALVGRAESLSSGLWRYALEP